MKRMFLFTGILLLIFMTACQSADANEVLEYHNSYVKNITDKMDHVDEANNQIWEAESEEEISDTIDNDLEPLLEKMRTYMDEQDPEKDVTKEYHEMRLKAFDSFYESMQIDIKTYKGLLDDTLSDEDADKNFEESEKKFEEAQKLSEEADKKIDELADKYKFEQEEAE